MTNQWFIVKILGISRFEWYDIMWRIDKTKQKTLRDSKNQKYLYGCILYLLPKHLFIIKPTIV